MNRRVAVLAVLLAASGLAPAAGVTAAEAKAKPAPKPVCLMLTDPRGDAKIHGQGNDYPADDIVSADIATGSKTIVGVLRLASADSASGLPTGGTYELEWTQTKKGSDGTSTVTQSAFFFYVYATGGTSGGFGTSTNPDVAPQDNSSQQGAPTPQATMHGNGVISWVMSRKDAGIVSGAKFALVSATSIVAANYRVASGSGHFGGDNIDGATGHATYTDRQASCVHAS